VKPPRLRARARSLLASVILNDRRGHRVALVLFGLTALSVAGTGWAFHADHNGLAFAVATMFILLSHEMGHFVACRLHGVDSTWPFFLPAPVLNPLVGTLGAVMAIRDRFPTRRALFDIGVAGPLAGVAACLVVLAVGSATGHVTGPLSGEATGGEVWELGVPLLWEPTLNALRGANAGHALGTLGLAAWFGLLLTGLNLIPIGQLDGGHVLYAVFPRRARLFSRFAWVGGIALAVWTPAWLFWGILIGFLGRRGHPTTVDDSLPIGGARIVVAVVALAVFVLTFIPQPIVYTWEMLLHDLGL